MNISYTALLGFSIAFEDEVCFYVPIRHKGNNASFLDLHHIMELVQGFAAVQVHSAYHFSGIAPAA